MRRCSAAARRVRRCAWCQRRRVSLQHMPSASCAQHRTRVTARLQVGCSRHRYFAHRNAQGQTRPRWYTRCWCARRCARCRARYRTECRAVRYMRCNRCWHARCCTSSLRRTYARGIGRGGCSTCRRRASIRHVCCCAWHVCRCRIAPATTTATARCR